MGHTRLGVLPASRRWDQIRELVGGEGSAADIGAATFSEVVRLFGDSDKQQVGLLAREGAVIDAFWFLMTLPVLARNDKSFKAASEQEMGISPDAWKNPVALVAAIRRQLQVRNLNAEATVFAHLAVDAASRAASEMLSHSNLSLFESTDEQLRRAWAKQATSSKFGGLAEQYLTNLLESTLQYYVSRVTPQALGPKRRFADLEDVRAFNNDVRVWCGERARVARRFAAGWLSKVTYQRGRPGEDDARGFVAYALAKVGSEVRAHSPSK